MLKKYSKQLKRVAEALLEYETLDGDQIRDLCKGLNISIKKSEDKDDAPKAKKPKNSWYSFYCFCKADNCYK